MPFSGGENVYDVKWYGHCSEVFRGRDCNACQLNWFFKQVLIQFLPQRIKFFAAKSSNVTWHHFRTRLTCYASR